MIPINFEYDSKFLNESYYNGEKISSDMKKLWLVELDILNKFVQVCDKYGIEYFAEGGTLLGTVRHKGFIPWDDDVDVIMMRSEYEKFLAVAKKEFEYPYYVMTGVPPAVFTRIKRLDTMKISTQSGRDMRQNTMKMNVAFLPCVSIDVFCFDNCPESEEERQQFHKKLLERQIKFKQAFYLFRKYYNSNTFTEEQIDKMRDKITDAFNVFNEYCQTYNDKETKYIFNSGLPQFKIEDGMMRLREDYNESIYLPFENLTLRCPKNYDSVLNMHYTERTGISWKVPTKNLGYHTQGLNMFLDVDNPYTKYCTYAFWRDKDMDLIPKPEV